MAVPDAEWTFDPDDPRAPPLAVWQRMSDEERAAVAAALPSDFPSSYGYPPEGDAHTDAWVAARDTLRRWFRRLGRDVYIGGNLPVYYPDEPVFSPDVIAVVDVSPASRERWLVAEQGRGIDLAIEVVCCGDRRKDLRDNVTRYARLGIKEYFVFDRGRLLLQGYRLKADDPAKYEALVPEGGRFTARVLALELFLEGEKLRFANRDAVVPEADEIIRRYEDLAEAGQRRALELEAQLVEEQRRREDEHAHCEAVEKELTDLRAEVARLRR